MLNKKIFSDRIKELREQKGISTRSLANAIGLKSHGAITQFEKGTSLPALDTLVALAEFFEVTLDYLVGLTDFPYPVPNSVKKTINHIDNPGTLATILDQINENEIRLPKHLHEIEDLIKGLDNESMLELQKFLRYLHMRQSLGNTDETSDGLE